MTEAASGGDDTAALPTRICDPHQHFWLPQRNPYPWLQIEPPAPFRYGDTRPLRRDYLPRHYRADAAGLPIIATVHIEAEWRSDDPLGETAWLASFRPQEGLPSVAVAAARLDHGDAGEVLARHAAYGFVRGIRHKPAATARPEDVLPARGTMDDPAWRRGYALLAEHGFSFDLQVPWWHLTAATRLARDFPRTTIILNHTGLPADRSRDRINDWRRALEQFARAENVAVKISGLGLAGEPWSIAGNRPIVRDAVSIFGVERCMFASNFPVDSLVAGLRQIFTGFAAMVSDLPEPQRDALFYGNALRVYRLDASS